MKKKKQSISSFKGQWPASIGNGYESVVEDASFKGQWPASIGRWVYNAYSMLLSVSKANGQHQ